MIFFLRYLQDFMLSLTGIHHLDQDILFTSDIDLQECHISLKVNEI